MNTIILRLKLLGLTFGLLFSTSASAFVVSDYGVDPKAEARRQARLKAAQARGAARLKAAKSKMKKAKSQSRSAVAKPTKKKVVARKTAKATPVVAEIPSAATAATPSPAPKVKSPDDVTAVTPPAETVKAVAPTETLAAVPPTETPKAATESTGRTPEPKPGEPDPVTKADKSKKLTDLSGHSCATRAKSKGNAVGNPSALQQDMDQAMGIKGFLTPKSQALVDQYPTETFTTADGVRMNFGIAAPDKDGVSRYMIYTDTANGTKFQKVKEVCASKDRILVMVDGGEGKPQSIMEIKKGKKQGSFALRLEGPTTNGKITTADATLAPLGASRPTIPAADTEIATAQ